MQASVASLRLAAHCYARCSLLSARPVACLSNGSLPLRSLSYSRDFSSSVRRADESESKDDAASPKPPPLSTFHDAMTYSWRCVDLSDALQQKC